MGHWRTSTSGHASRAASEDITDGRIIRGSRLESFETEEDGRIRKRDRCPRPRKCLHCGARVCSYKDPHQPRVYCYAHDHMAEWTHRYIIGTVSGKRGTSWYNGESERGHLE